MIMSAIYDGFNQVDSIFQKSNIYKKHIYIYIQINKSYYKISHWLKVK